jgi:bifunctional UDP-N-acetylglucosamine pyrophosphorylase/glucosamine-1-phosphate N-acetyltransferase
MPKARANNSQAPRLAIAIMAAGKGTRLKSKYPKVLHEVGGKPLLAHVIVAATQVVPAQHVYAIIGHEADKVRQAVGHTGVKFVEQKPQKGTGHALMVARDALSSYDRVIVLYGDAPLITPATITQLRDFHAAKRAAMTILTGRLQDPTGYGRVLRKNSKSDEVQAIVEEKAATPAQKKIHEINSGTYAFAVAPLFQHIDKLRADNAHAEFYLTDMAAILRQAKARGRRPRPILAKCWAEILAPNWSRSISTSGWPSVSSSCAMAQPSSILKLA